MPKTKAQKATMISDLSQKVAAAEAIFVVAPKSVNPNEASALKMRLSAVGGEYHMVKNSIFVRALQSSDYVVAPGLEAGQNAVIFAGAQAPEAAKIVKKFIKDSDKAEFKVGYLQRKQISASDIVALADLPSREVMLAQVLGTMNAPISGFVQVLAGNLRNFVNVVDAYRKTKVT